MKMVKYQRFSRTGFALNVPFFIDAFLLLNHRSWTFKLFSDWFFTHSLATKLRTHTHLEIKLHSSIQVCDRVIKISHTTQLTTYWTDSRIGIKIRAKFTRVGDKTSSPSFYSVIRVSPVWAMTSPALLSVICVVITFHDWQSSFQSSDPITRPRLGNRPRTHLNHM